MLSCSSRMGHPATRNVHPLLSFARLVTKPGDDEPALIDADAKEQLAHAIRVYADTPDLAEGIRALGEFAAWLAKEGSPAAGLAVVRALEQVGPELEYRFDAGEIAAALDDVGLSASAFPRAKHVQY
jgi:hypothetical protein